MTRELLVAGGGIAGLAAAVAARRARWEARLFEQADTFSEVGAGIQLGPNATRILREWDLLQGELQQLAVAPPRLRVRDGSDGGELGVLELGGFMVERYGAPYLTVHRADLQAALLAAARDAGTRLHTATHVHGAQQRPEAVALRTDGPEPIEGDALAVADGVWSSLRGAVVADGPAQATGHLAYRGLVRQQDLPERLRSDEVTVWLAPRMHLVTYPLRGGEWLNAVCVVQGTQPGDPRDWDHAASQAQLDAALGPVCAPVRERVESVPTWRLWVLHARPPVAAPEEMANGRIALAGDAAHPMRPYLAQGAGMAIEDARELQRVLGAVDDNVIDVPTALRRYALNRWERVAQVQEKSQRNGTIFHATGPLRMARNAAMWTLGARLLDQPWLYEG
ncbi:FAD-dependent monooxygenase [Ramlibacter montanisoli]|uniref:FAD-dependent oxidoreductase n=1 Tax=Ramlibacter montanisoli TaxID=2732512 RepID=A0A849K148_9BURK|nr:FAD-dependent monooxygenase [Ramlibacter montanisoli]NNU42242.1 FAD-dependent oxidoreductase [Ramlibacter montanisoli]